MALTTRLLLVLVLVGLAGSAGAGELVRYRTPDGSVGFTNDASRVPAGAQATSERRLPEREAATAAPSRAAPASKPARRPFAFDLATTDEEAERRARWVGKRDDATEALREVRSHLAVLDVAHEGNCRKRRGHRPHVDQNVVYINGVRHRGAHRFDDEDSDKSARCAELVVELEEAQAEQQRLRGYLAEGLEEECRRAEDCLPGYLRD